MDAWPSILGETPLPDRSGLRVKTIQTRDQLNEAEFSNIGLAVAKYLARRPTGRMAPFTLRWVLRLHKEMLGQVWIWAGKPRQTDVTNYGCPPWQIETKLQELLDDLRCWDGYGMEIVEQAARLHYRAVKIHPFLNGNGRWARLLSAIWQKRHDSPLTYWPEQDISAEGSSTRGIYLESLRQADIGDYAPLIALHRQFTQPIG